MKNQIIALNIVMGLFLPSIAFASGEQRDFQCSVSTLSKESGWTYGQKYNYSAEVKEWNGKYAQTSQTIKLSDGYEVILDLKWEDSTLNNDDISTKKDPKIILSSRLQKLDSQGKLRILGFANETVGRAEPGVAITKKIFATNMLMDLEKFSTLLTDVGLQSNVSNGDLERAADGNKMPGGLYYFSVGCSTSL